jgi:hypothetical protein
MVLLLSLQYTGLIQSLCTNIRRKEDHPSLQDPRQMRAYSDAEKDIKVAKAPRYNGVKVYGGKHPRIIGTY